MKLELTRLYFHWDTRNKYLSLKSKSQLCICLKYSQKQIGMYVYNMHILENHITPWDIISALEKSSQIFR